MTSNSLIRGRRDVIRTGDGIPASTDNVKLGELYQNTGVSPTKGEVFCCWDNTPDNNMWIGSLGNTGDQSILSASHPDLLAFYTMDNTSGNLLLDSSPHGRTITMVSLVQDTGVIGSSLQMRNPHDGAATQYGTLPRFSLVGDFALSFWLDPVIHNTSNRYYIFGTQYIFLNHDGIIWSPLAASGGIQVVTTSYIVSQQSPIGDGFKHIVIQREGSVLSQYVSGSAYGSNASVSTGDIRIDTFGAYFPTLGGQNLNADMDQIRLFDRALTEEEITTLYNEGL
ncbi:LamG domain-containing protein [bacterium]|nr:LamG domain-containing protein [bacterium]